MQILYAFLILGGLGLILGLGLAIASKILYVKIDSRIEEITKLLPNYNCGACGSSGCSQFAEKIVAGNVTLSSCKPGNAEKNYNSILSFLQENPNDDGKPYNVKI